VNAGALIIITDVMKAVKKRGKKENEETEVEEQK
jgi:hypothetical protein